MPLNPFYENSQIDLLYESIRGNNCMLFYCTGPFCQCTFAEIRLKTRIKCISLVIAKVKEDSIRYSDVL